MLCKKCGKYTATTHIKTVINGQVVEQNLCGYCAAKSGYVGLTSDNFANLMTSMLTKSIQLNSNITFKEKIHENSYQQYRKQNGQDN